MSPAVSGWLGADQRTSQPNLTRTLAKLEAAGFVTMKTTGRRKTPNVAVRRIFVEIDPYCESDRLRVA